MAKNQRNQKSSGVCGKLCNAIRWRAQSPMPSSPAPAPAPHPQIVPVSATGNHASRLKAAASQMPSSGEVIPVEIHPHLLPKLQNPQEKTANYQDSFRKSGQMQPQKKLKMQESINDRFTAYINRVKHGMLRTSSNVGSAKISSGHDSFDDNVRVNNHSSEYIRRAHMKMKNASNVAGAGGKSVVTFK
ncbi:hypothetical protein POM88_050221 [Heracleum sosnowskyi]|uniref:Uncharacterized protein n=1 Tax=Heracleum sosnowskyi TaxID=360622 RepID=A0AAD8GZP9_9APIA|nr:hypothetical protein POM88_050221 [Heracleum sosnowskyi]